jgi:hypothetical protein
MGTHQDLIDPAAEFLRLVEHVAVHGVDVGGGEDTAADAALVGGDRDPHAGRGEQAEAGHGTLLPDPVLGFVNPTAIGGLAVEDAVAVEDDVADHHATNSIYR